MSSVTQSTPIDVEKAMLSFQLTLKQTYPILKEAPVTLQGMQGLLNQHEPFFRLSIEDSPSGVPATAWFDRDFSIAVTAFSEFMQTKKPFAAPIWQKTLNACLFTSLIGLRLRFNCVPDLSFEDLHIETGDDHRVSKLSIPADTNVFVLATQSDVANSTPVSNHDALDKKLAEVITRLGEAMQPHFKSQKVATKLFWGNALYACGLAYSKLFNRPIDTQVTNADLFIQNQWFQSLSNQVQNKGGELNEIKKVEFKGFQKWFVRRETCCLKYKIDGKAKCTTCNLIEPSEQIGMVQTALKYIVQQN